MKVRIAIVTKMDWKTMPEKQAKVRETIMRARGVTDVEFVVIKKDPGKPKTKTDAEGVTRIDHAWFEKNITPEAYENDCLWACFLFSIKDGDAWGIDSGLRGNHIRDIDDIGELWVKADEHTIEKYPDGVRMNRFEKTLPHEVGHDLKYRGITNRDIHDFDYKRERHDVEGFYKQVDFRLYSDLYERSELLKRVVLLTRLKLSGYAHLSPIDPKYRSHLTQGFGIKNSEYTSGIHNGTDYWLPISVPVYAPQDGKITQVFEDNASMGNAAYFSYGNRHLRLLHLSRLMPVGSYKKGDIIGYSGNTGLSTGPHLHIEVWRVPINTALLKTEKLVRTNLIDPHLEFAGAR